MGFDNFQRWAVKAALKLAFKFIFWILFKVIVGVTITHFGLLFHPPLAAPLLERFRLFGSTLLLIFRIFRANELVLFNHFQLKRIKVAKLAFELFWRWRQRLAVEARAGKVPVDTALVVLAKRKHTQTVWVNLFDLLVC